jgi:serine/threonine-protein kinase HipA
VADRLLHVLMYGQPMARLVARGNNASLTYEDAWLSRRDAFALSLSLPLAAREHAARVVDPYLWNLLPDNHATLVDWARQFKVKLKAFALLEHVGEDVAGAAQFVRPERLEEVMGKDSGAVQWIDEAEIARRLRELRVNRSAWSQPGDVGYFSLPGAQPKLALLHEDGRWGIPSGRTPTTHILKPPIPDFDDYAHNEHFCMTLAAAAGLSAAKSTLQCFKDEHAFVTERFDRVRLDGRLLRVPAEDLCQALRVHPENKYQNRGGPAPEAIFKLLLSESSRPQDDCGRFFDALVFNALIGGTDAHAKNYTLLQSGGRVRLAPLYDLGSALPYYNIRELKLAMKIGHHYELASICARDWERVGATGGIDSPRERVRAMVGQLPERVDATFKEFKSRGLAAKVIGVLRTRILQQVKTTLAVLDAAS